MIRCARLTSGFFSDERQSSTEESSATSGAGKVAASGGKCALRVCTRRQRSRYGASKARTQRRFSFGIFWRSWPLQRVTTVRSRASWSETITRHPAKPVTSISAPASAEGIANCARCASWGLATNSMLRAATWKLPVAETFGGQDCMAELFANENATSFAGFECLSVLGTNPPKYWPALERRQAHPCLFRAGPNAPTGARGDRGRFPTDQGFPNKRASWRIVQVSLVPFRHSGKNL